MNFKQLLKLDTTKRKPRRHLTSSQVIIIGFFTVIMTGALLLMLPWATQQRVSTPFIDTLFTATSATCVTGLVVHDTATYWSFFGHLIILVLIQIGGMGVVTVAIAIAAISGRKIGLMQRNTMQESISAHQMGGIVRMTQFILKTACTIELIGAIAMSFVFCPEFGFWKGIWYSIFHSISAFCNAGFDLMGFRQPYSSLCSYTAQPIINFTIMALIVTGGIGFLTWSDINKYRWNWNKYSLQSKIVLTTTFFLITMPALYFYCCEFHDGPGATRIWNSFFQSVTTRTAGFNTVDLATITETGRMLMIVLMVIGGSPGSTAGGMKCTTFTVLCASACAVFGKKGSAQLFTRRISDETVKNAATIFLMYIVTFVSGAMLISSVENVPILTGLFETGSAIGTVGLSLGLTPTLTPISKLILIAIMFFGRVGGLTLIFAALFEMKTDNARYPQGKITVG